MHEYSMTLIPYPGESQAVGLKVHGGGSRFRLSEKALGHIVCCQVDETRLANYLIIYLNLR